MSSSLSLGLWFFWNDLHQPNRVMSLLSIDVFRFNTKAAWLTIGLSGVTALLFLVPFVVWTQDGIPYYDTAAVYAMVLVVAMCYVGYHYLRRRAITPTNLITAYANRNAAFMECEMNAASVVCCRPGRCSPDDQICLAGRTG